MNLLIIITLTIFFATFLMGISLYKGSSTNFDLRVKAYFEDRYYPGLFNFMKIFTRLANVETIFILVVIMSLKLTLSKKFVDATSIILATVTSSIASHGLKLIFRRARPVKRKKLNYIGYSFPSGHSTIGISFYTVLFYLIQSNLGLPNIFILIGYLIGILLGFSRIYLSAHWAIDVLFGIMLGSLCAVWTIIANLNGLDLISPFLVEMNIL